VLLTESWLDTEAIFRVLFVQIAKETVTFSPVSTIESNATVERTLRGLASGDGPFSRWATTHSTYQMPEEFRIVSTEDSHFVFQMKNSDPAFVIARITYVPSWRAVAQLAGGRSINLPVNQVDLNFMGYEVPSGARQVSIFYSSRADRTLILLWFVTMIPLCVIFILYVVQILSGGIGVRGLEIQ